MIKDIANIIEWIQYNEIQYFKLRVSKGGDIIFSDGGLESPTVDMVTAHLQKRLEMLEPGIYFLEGWNDHMPKNERRYVKFTITGSSNNMQSGNFMPAVSGFTKDQVHEEIQRALTEYQIKTENERLKLENAELRSKQEDIGFNFSKRIVEAWPYLGAMLDRYLPEVKAGQQVAITGIENKNEMDKDLLTLRAEKAVEQWFQLDKDAVLLMENIVKLAREDPAMYKQAKTFLMK
jgi:hypothetical protein